MPTVHMCTHAHLDFLGKGSTEHQCLAHASPRHGVLFNDATDLWLKAHVQHTISLVKYTVPVHKKNLMCTHTMVSRSTTDKEEDRKVIHTLVTHDYRGHSFLTGVKSIIMNVKGRERERKRRERRKGNWK